MQQIGQAGAARRTIVLAGWTILAAAFVYYLVQAIRTRFLTPGQMGPGLWDRQIWFYLHLAFALPAVVIGPFQFSTRLRSSRPVLHRWLGRTYIACSLIASAAAIVLAITSEYAMDRPALTLLASLWLFFTLAAYVCARRRDFTAHRLFVIRSYAAVVAFVLLRLLVEAPVATLFPFIVNGDVLEAVETWLAVALVLFGVEMIFSWIPQLRGRHHTR